MVSVVESLIAIFFTCYQQRALIFIRRPVEFRAWMSNGLRYVNAGGTTVFQSSMASHQFLQAPFELLGISITLFLAALGIYLGSAYMNNVALNTGGVGNLGVLIAYIVAAAFGLALFGHLLGEKDIEFERGLKQLEEFHSRSGVVVLQSAGNRGAELDK